MKRKSIWFASFLFFLIFPSSVKGETLPSINEFLVTPSSGSDEWIEIYNPDSVDLAEYLIDDDSDFSNDSGSSGKKKISENTSDTKAVFLTISYSSSFLNTDGDFVVLFKPDGTIIDQFQYSENPGVDVTIGRNPDGIGDFGKLQSATKGGANSQILTPTATPTPTTIPTREPSNTPTPSKTPTPTKSPTPIKEPTLTKTPSPIKTPTRTPTPKQDVLSASSRNTKSASPTPTPEITKNLPTPILGTKEKSSIKDEFASLKNEDEISDAPKVLGASTNLIPWFFIGGGSIFLLSCGILAFILKKKEQA